MFQVNQSVGDNDDMSGKLERNSFFLTFFQERDQERPGDKGRQSDQSTNNLRYRVISHI